MAPRFETPRAGPFSSVPTGPLSAGRHQPRERRASAATDFFKRARVVSSSYDSRASGDAIFRATEVCLRPLMVPATRSQSTKRTQTGRVGDKNSPVVPEV